MRAVFFVRHNNDFDSLAAVADAWVAASPDNEALVYVASSALKWRNDFRTRMLLRHERISFTSLWQVAGWRKPGLVERLWQGDKPDRRTRRRLLELATEALVAPGFDRRIVDMLEAFSPDIVAFDWWEVPARRKPFDHFGYQATVAWATSKGIPLVSLPHGLFLFTSRETATLGGTPYACIFVENEGRRQRYIAGGHAPDSIFVSGSPRYDPSWVARVVEELRRGEDRPATDDGFVKVVFFDRHGAFYFDFDQHLDWLIHLADHPRVKLTVQPHPRGQKLKSLSRLANHPSIAIDADTPASLLIDRCDICSTLTVSVMVEAVITGKEILYPKFLNAVATRFEEKGACIALQSSEETHPAIDRYLSGERVPRANYDAFLHETVFGGGSDNTRERICKRMTEIACSART